MEADIYTLFSSDFYQVLDFRCRCSNCTVSKPEYTDAFSISFVRKGNFLFNVFRRSYDSYTGTVLLTKPGYEHTVAHVHSVPDECTIIEFKKDFYHHIKEHYSGSFFTNGDLHSLKIVADPKTEFLHYQLIQLLSNKTYSKLQLDSVVMEIVERTLGCIHHSNIDKMLGMRLKKNHLITIERAKAFMIEELENDISLIDVADKCNVSPFHFCRTFKQFTSYSPYQFLLMARLMHARMLLKTTNLPITDIAYASGFNSIAHFTAAFSAKNEMAPGKFREGSKTYAKTARILNT